jgi:hypothetical protein
MLMLIDIFAALLALSATVVWLSTREPLSSNGDHRHGKVTKA